MNQLHEATCFALLARGRDKEGKGGREGGGEGGREEKMSWTQQRYKISPLPLLPLRLPVTKVVQVA